VPSAGFFLHRLDEDRKRGLIPDREPHSACEVPQTAPGLAFEHSAEIQRIPVQQKKGQTVGTTTGKEK